MQSATNYCLKNFLSPETLNYNLFGKSFLENLKIKNLSIFFIYFI